MERRSSEKHFKHLSVWAGDNQRKVRSRLCPCKERSNQNVRRVNFSNARLEIGERNASARYPTVRHDLQVFTLNDAALYSKLWHLLRNMMWSFSRP